MPTQIASRFCGVLMLCLAFSTTSPGQQTQGLPPFGSFGGGPADTVNNASLNVHYEFPVFSRAGRGVPFSYSLSYDSEVWAPVTSGSSKVWTPVSNWGWGFVTQPQLGYIRFSTTQNSCTTSQHLKITWTTWMNFSYVDGSGTPHPFALGVSNWQSDSGCGSGLSANATGVTSDGSGYTMSVSAGDSTVSTSVTDRSGNGIGAPQLGTGSGTFNDTNGNEITTSVGSTTTFVDTLGTTALTVSGAGTQATPITYSYTNQSGGTSSYTLNYTNQVVKTNFGCSGISEYTSSSQPLVSSLSLPDGTFYSFTYEPTPGGGGVTGRLQSVKLPTGGTITYSYTGGSGGIVCADGTTPVLQRATPDGTWKYSHSGTAPAYTTVITDPAGNQTSLQFQSIYETQRQVYQGSTASGTMLEQVDTCYNNATIPCTATAVTLPITQVAVKTTLPGSTALISETVTNYNSYGLTTEVDQYDFGSGGVGSLLKKTLTSYASLGNNIMDRPASVQYENGSGTLLSQTSYSYDQTSVSATSGTPQHLPISGSRGNATTIQTGRSGAGLLTQQYSYFDTGNVYQATDTNGAITTYTFGNCGNSFISSVAFPLSLSTSQSWNCTGAVLASTTDANGQNWSTGYADPNYWRPTSTTDPTNAVTSLSYTVSPSTTVESTLNFNGGTSTSDVLTTLDGLGRPQVTQQRQTQGGSNFDSVQTTYDALGRPYKVSLPYTASAGQTSTTAPVVTTTYDALGRPLSVTDAGGGVTSYSYTQNDVLVTVGPAPSTENTKRRQLQYDGAGRLTSVCEITSASGSGSCGQTVAQTGFLTQYTYDGVDNLAAIKQNAQSSSPQSRTFVVDALHRTTAENNPETGNTLYTFDTDSTCGTSAGDLVKRTDNASNVTCYGYDALHRNTSISYPSGPNAGNTPTKYFVYDAATFAFGGSAVNAKGRLAEAYTGTPSAKITDLCFYYTARGEVDNTFELTPHSGGYYQVAENYWANGLPQAMATNISGLPSWSITPDGEGRMNSVTASSGLNPLNSAVYGAFGATTLNFGSGDSDTFTYDQNTGRETQYKFNVGSGSETSTLTWNANGTLQQLAINDALTSANTQTCNNTYDDLARLITNNCGTVWNQNFSYDVFGNMKTSGSGSFMPTYNAATNQYAALASGSPSYSANGAVTNDGNHSYYWDSEGKNVQLDTTLTMTYDAFGRWVEQNVSGSGYKQAVYAPDGSKTLLMAGSNVVTAYVYLPQGAIASYSGNTLYVYWHPDWLGTPRLYSTTSRTVDADVEIAPYGTQYPTSPWVDTFFGGAGQLVEANDLRTYPARNLSIWEGRWLTPDPAGLAAVDLTNPQSLNRYAYVLGNPLGLVDPSGMIGEANPTPVTPAPPQPGQPIFIPTGGNVSKFCILCYIKSFHGLGVPTPAKKETLTCSGSARVLKGNSKQIGLPGGWDGDFIKPHILVTKNGAAIIPSQWGVTDKGPFRQFLGDISGKFPNANAAFQGVSDIVGGKRDPMFPKLPVQQGLMAHYPGVLIIELPGGNDLETTAVTLSVPSAVGCPQGTSVVP